MVDLLFLFLIFLWLLNLQFMQLLILFQYFFQFVLLLINLSILALKFIKYPVKDLVQILNTLFDFHLMIEYFLYFLLDLPVYAFIDIDKNILIEFEYFRAMLATSAIMVIVLGVMSVIKWWHYRCFVVKAVIISWFGVLYEYLVDFLVLFVNLRVDWWVNIQTVTTCEYLFIKWHVIQVFLFIH